MEKSKTVLNNNSQMNREEAKIDNLSHYQDYSNNENDNSGGFQEAIGTVLTIAQFCGIMPVIGVRSKSASKLRFDWNSYRTIHFFVVACILTGWASMCFGVLFITEVNFARITPVVYFISAASGIWSFGNLAQKWPGLMLQWQEMEAKMPKYRSLQKKHQLSFRIKLFVCCFGICAVTEHLLTALSTIYYVKACRPNYDPVAGFFERQIIQLFSITDYALWKGVFGKTVNVLAAFISNYMNIFIVMISVGISTRLKQLNDELALVKSKPLAEKIWEHRRAQYRCIVELCEAVDDEITPITIITLSNNLFFICVQLTKSLRPLPSAAHAIYFWFSLLFLICRTIAFLQFAAVIHDESKRPADVLRAVPKIAWCIEVERFIEEIDNGRLALTGMHFFSMTRKLILSVFGTILT